MKERLQQLISSSPASGPSTPTSSSSNLPSARRRMPLTEEQFKDDFVLKNFIEGLSRRIVFDMVRQERETGEPSFTTEPFRLAFEGALGDLRVLDGVFDRKLEEALERCVRAEETFQRQTDELLAGQQECQQQLEAMDRRMADSTASAVGVGERLAVASAQRESVEAAMEVMGYFAELNEGRATSAVFVDPERIHERESVLKNLRDITVGLSDTDERTRVGVAGVDTQCRQLVKQLLERFRAAVNKNDVRSMQLFAASLFDFDGGESCVEAYLHEAFARSAPPLKLGGGGGGGGGADPPVSLEAASAHMRKFFVHLTGQLDREYATIQAVFPEPAAVLTTVLEKVFEWAGSSKGGGSEPFPLSLRALLERVRTASERSGPEAYLVLLADAYDRTRALVEHLRSFTLEAGVDLDRMMDFVFSSSRDSYLERELVLQERQYAARLASFQGLLSPVWLAAARQSSATRFPWEDATPDATREMSLDDVEVTKYFLHCNRTAMERCVKLSHRKDVGPNICALYKLLLRMLGQQCVTVAVDMHLELVPDKPNVKKPLSVTFLYVALAVNTIVLDLEQFHHTVVMPKVASSINEPTKCNSMKAKLVHSLEQRLSHGLQKLVRVMAAQAAALLAAKQRRNDYKLGVSDFAARPTAACVATADFLDAQHVIVTSCLDGGNADAFLARLGTLFYDALLAHLKHCAVSMGLGGAQLMLDLSRYLETIRRFRVTALDAQFAVLKSLANLHLVEEANLRPLLKELLIVVPRADLAEYLSTHEHFTSKWLTEYL